jgi:glycosyltransferase involved in cell wall biosynthesis
MRIGTGLQNKLLEAMSMKIPCITTPIANNALGGTEGEHLLIGTTAAELAGHIISLLNDRQQADQIANNGFIFVHGNYNWESATGRLSSRFEELVQSK